MATEVTIPRQRERCDLVSQDDFLILAWQAPVKLHGLDGRYATSLWKVASEQGKLPQVEKDLAAFSVNIFALRP